MSQKFTEEFKIQAVEKALSRSPEITLVEMAETLGVSRSALQRWITQSRNQELGLLQSPLPLMTNTEKRPQDWNGEERLKLIIESDGLSEEATSELCRVRGIFTYHIKDMETTNDDRNRVVQRNKKTSIHQNIKK